jgi:hypothetical protein
MLALAVIAQYHPENGFLCFYATSSQASICLVLLSAAYMLLWYSKTIKLFQNNQDD